MEPSDNGRLSGTSALDCHGWAVVPPAAAARLAHVIRYIAANLTESAPCVPFRSRSRSVDGPDALSEITRGSQVPHRASFLQYGARVIGGNGPLPPITADGE